MAKSKSKAVRFLKVVEFLKQEGFKKFSLSKEDDDYVEDALKEDNIGTYVFVVKKSPNKESEFTKYESFMREVTGQFLDAKGNSAGEMVIVPEFNGEIDDDIMHFEKGKIFYVGSAKKVKSRIIKHITSNTLSKNSSLKLGFETREEAKKYLDVYVHHYKRHKEAVKAEKNIRSTFGAYFGR